MRGIFLLALIFAIFLEAQPSQAIYIDKEKGICRDSPPENNLSLKNPIPKKKHHWLITIDGMEKWSTAFSFWPETPTIYLYEAISSNKILEDFSKKQNGIVTPFAWARDMSKSNEAVENLYQQIKSINLREESVNILAHSWGSVIAYVMISKHPDIKIDRLVTIGSPLNSQDHTVLGITRAHLAARDIFSIKKPCNVRNWYNFWIKCDTISGEIKGTRDYWNKEQTGKTSECHSNYFRGHEEMWTMILRKAMCLEN